ncbi:polysaccharide deacetylase [Thiobacillus denitrificans ATCC 25259]|uniref:Polysaccharide deacetylase n=1 Tax=Thiobacillus denitrificans (strain ATCC 25259 / T1) TaxID=292415 RepID=Q3SM12_THIDA|nr:XrtA system polysaccharide deacetylase [Thiobacillus denitrificans]AAZ96240.1 polysaccharide deacetylase [Thiobacillus denitrificans ATCC 25259]
MKNALSVDVEDYFQVSAFAPHIPREQWNTLPCRVERNVDLILDLFDESRSKATFFTLGWIAERYPQVVRRIVDNGHELASHGYGHERASDLTPAAFREDITRAKRILEDLGGVAVRGYRAPSFSIDHRNWWAVAELEEAGYVYSSSIYPVRHDHYGMPDAPRFPHRPNGERGILEVPPTTLPLFGRNLPAAGGGWFRLLPYEMSRWMLKRVNARDGAPCMFYFHPWEVDPEQPRPSGVSMKARFRHYVNLQRTAGRLRRLLNDFEWDRVDRVFLGEP